MQHTRSTKIKTINAGTSQAWYVWASLLKWLFLLSILAKNGCVCNAHVSFIADFDLACLSTLNKTISVKYILPVCSNVCLTLNAYGAPDISPNLKRWYCESFWLLVGRCCHRCLLAVFSLRWYCNGCWSNATSLEFLI